jgi:hypothetical protein
MAKKNFTVAEIIESAEKNGLKWGGPSDKPRYDEANDRTGRQCILEQAATNLGLGADGWQPLAEVLDSLGDAKVAKRTYYIGSAIWHYNDDVARSYKGALGYLKRVLTPYVNKTVTIWVKEDA